MTGESPEPDDTEIDGVHSLALQYPTHHVVAVLDTQQQLDNALEALTRDGILESEIGIGSGTETADRLSATTGRSGFAAHAIRFAEKLGMVNGYFGRFMIERLSPP